MTARCLVSHFGLCRFFAKLPVQQDKQHSCRFVGAIAPGVIRAALYHDVTGTEFGFYFVEHQPDFAGEQNAVINRFSAVHQFVRRIALMRRSVGGSDLREACGYVRFGDLVLNGVGRNVYDADDAALRRRMQLQRPQRRIGAIRLHRN